MPRTNIDAGNALAISQPITTPVYLFELAGYFNLCGYDAIANHNGIEWVPADMRVSGPTQRAGGTYEATISLPASYPGLMTAFLGQRLTDVAASLYQTYFLDGSYYSEAVLLLKGSVLDVYHGRGGERSPARVSIQIASVGNRQGVSPNIRVAPPLFNTLNAPGTIILWNNQIIGVEQ